MPFFRRNREQVPQPEMPQELEQGVQPPLPTHVDGVDQSNMVVYYTGQFGETLQHDAAELTVRGREEPKAHLDEFRGRSKKALGALGVRVTRLEQLARDERRMHENLVRHVDRHTDSLGRYLQGVEELAARHGELFEAAQYDADFARMCKDKIHARLSTQDSLNAERRRIRHSVLSLGLSITDQMTRADFLHNDIMDARARLEQKEAAHRQLLADKAAAEARTRQKRTLEAQFEKDKKQEDAQQLMWWQDQEGPGYMQDTVPYTGHAEMAVRDARDEVDTLSGQHGQVLEVASGLTAEKVQAEASIKDLDTRFANVGQEIAQLTQITHELSALSNDKRFFYESYFKPFLGDILAEGVTLMQYGNDLAGAIEERDRYVQGILATEAPGVPKEQQAVIGQSMEAASIKRNTTLLAGKLKELTGMEVVVRVTKDMEGETEDVQVSLVPRTA